jgi:hypothetical protein
VGERLYGFRNFTELYAVFSTPRILTVLHGGQEVGTVEAAFVQGQDVAQLTFILAARTWRVTSADLSHGILRVEPAPEGKHTRWNGRPTLLRRELCQAIREVLVTSEADPWWSRRARTKIDELRAEQAYLQDCDVPLVPTALPFQARSGGRSKRPGPRSKAALSRRIVPQPAQPGGVGPRRTRATARESPERPRFPGPDWAT